MLALSLVLLIGLYTLIIICYIATFVKIDDIIGLHLTGYII